MIAGFEGPCSGEVFLQAKDGAQVPPNKREVNRVFESSALFPHWAVEENIGIG